MEEESEKDKTNKEEEDELNEESERDEAENHDQSICSRFTQFIDPIKGYIETINIKAFSLKFLLIILLIVIFTTSLPKILGKKIKFLISKSVGLFWFEYKNIILDEPLNPE